MDDKKRNGPGQDPETVKKVTSQVKDFLRDVLSDGDFQVDEESGEPVEFVEGGCWVPVRIWVAEE